MSTQLKSKLPLAIAIAFLLTSCKSDEVFKNIKTKVLGIQERVQKVKKPDILRESPNSAPQITGLVDLNVSDTDRLKRIEFDISDPNQRLSEITIGVLSENTNLVPNRPQNLEIEKLENGRFLLTVFSLPDAYGSSTIRVSASDGTAITEKSFEYQISNWCTPKRFSAIPFANINEEIKGDGSRGKPYFICSATQLLQLSKSPEYWNKHFVLKADINLGSLEPGQFTPIGSRSQRPFSGSIDGQGRSIKNLSLNLPNESGVGLFGLLSGAEIKDLHLQNVDIRGHHYVGGLAGAADRGTFIQGVSLADSDDQLDLTSQFENNSNGHLGGLIGQANQVTISRVQVGEPNQPVQLKLTWTSLETKADASSNAGGIAGEMFGSQIEYCDVNVRIQTGPSSGIGGVVGSTRSPSNLVSHCRVQSEIKTENLSQFSSRQGGIVGEGKDLEIKQTYSNFKALTPANEVGGIAGSLFDGKILDSLSEVRIQLPEAEVIFGGQRRGGLVGKLEDSKIAKRIINCASIGKISGYEREIGGLIGVLHSPESLISSSFASVDIHVRSGPTTDPMTIGPIVGKYFVKTELPHRDLTLFYDSERKCEAEDGRSICGNVSNYNHVAKSSPRSRFQPGLNTPRVEPTIGWDFSNQGPWKFNVNEAQQNSFPQLRKVGLSSSL